MRVRRMDFRWLPDTEAGLVRARGWGWHRLVATWISVQWIRARCRGCPDVRPRGADTKALTGTLRTVGICDCNGCVGPHRRPWSFATPSGDDRSSDRSNRDRPGFIEYTFTLPLLDPVVLRRIRRGKAGGERRPTRPTGPDPDRARGAVEAPRIRDQNRDSRPPARPAPRRRRQSAQ